MSDLINLRLDIFTYHHRGGLGESHERILENSQYFWNSLPNDFPTDLKIPLIQEDSLDSKEYGELLKLSGKNQSYYLFHPKNNLNKDIKAFYYPVRLNDTYGLAFACGIESYNEALPAKYFVDLRKLVPNYLIRKPNSAQRFKNNYMGATWMLSGCLAPNSDQSKEDIAKTICQKLNFCQEWSNVKSEEILGATIFEIGQTPKQGNKLEDNYHILIFLYNDPEKMDLVSKKFYKNWMQLFSYRNKIIWAYWQSQKDIAWLNDNFFSLDKVRKNPAIKSLIVEKQREFDDKSQIFNLKSLQEALQDNSYTLYEYVRRLSILKIQQQTIETNIDNYNERLDRISNDALKLELNTAKVEELNTAKVETLESFSNIVAKRYKKIVEKEYSSLRPGLDILQNLTETLRGYVQIQQAEIDRNIEKQNIRLEQQNTNFQNKLAIVGFGIGAASVAASSSAGFVEKIVKPFLVKIFQAQPLPIVLAFSNIIAALFISICIGLFCSFLISLIIYCRNRRQKKR